jgi:hypothetical protein
LETSAANNSASPPVALIAARSVEIDDRDLGALGGEQPGDLFADIAAGAGHDRHLILELHPVSPFTPATLALRSLPSAITFSHYFWPWVPRNHTASRDPSGHGRG